MKRIYPFTFYLVYYASAVFFQPFVILFFQELGFTGTQIGFLAGTIPLVVMVSAPLWTGIADAGNRHKLIMGMAILVTVLLTSLFPFLKSFRAIIPVVLLYALFAGPIISFADSATLSMLADDKQMYGRVRLGGTLGWGLVAPVAGVIIQRYGIQWAFWGAAAILAFTLLISQKFTYTQKAKAEPILGNIRYMLTDKRWVYLLTLAFVAGVAFTVVNSFLFPYMNSLGISKATMEISLTISTISELPVLFFAHRLLKRFKPHGLLLLAMVITALRLLLYGALNFQAGILAFQLLNGMTFPMFIVAGVAYANEISPEGLKSTAQGLFGSMLGGFGSAAGGVAAGLLLRGIGGQGLFLSAGVFVLVCLLVITLIERHQNAAQLKTLG